MELASRVYDVVTHPDGVTDYLRQFLPEVVNDDQRRYWRRVLRMAALCHDIGHLPFSHAAEKELLPDGWDHERLTQEMILSGHMRELWQQMTPPRDRRPGWHSCRLDNGRCRTSGCSIPVS